jgi:hypothetical protein
MFAIGVPFLVFDLPRFLAGMTLLGESMETGSRGLDLSHGWIHHLEYSLRYGLGLPLLFAGIVGMAVLIAVERRAAVLLLSFPIAYYIVAGSLRNLFFRYAIPLVPFLCIAAARLVTWAVPIVASGSIRTMRNVAQGLSPAYSRAATATIAIAALALVSTSAVSVFHFDRIISRTDNRVVVARWFDQNVPAGSSFLMSGSFYGYIQTTRDMRYRTWVWDRNRLIFVTDHDKRPGEGRPEWILLQESPLPSETQPIVLEFLRKDYTLVKHFAAFSPQYDHLYDQQDAFFAPFAGFRGVERPGPNFSLYKRVSAP